MPDAATENVLTDKAQLVAAIEKGCKPAAEWRIGTEHEKFAFTTDDLRPLPYEGPRGVEALLTALQAYGWEPVLEHGKVIALLQDGASISLEPGGQIELSGAPLENLHKTCNEVNAHLDQIRAIDEGLGIGMIGLGFQPKWARDDIPWMPKDRYKIMRAYMEKVGTLGHDMMKRTCTVQVNLDFSSEADMVQKFRVGLALQPVATAMFANSPFTEGKPNGYLSYRAHVWTDVDPDRTGRLPFVFEDGMSFERYVDHALDVPMYFVYRHGEYIDVSGQSFRDFMEGKLPGLPGSLPTPKDWDDHLTTLFPEVRMKQFLEMRGTDGGPWNRLCALPALWTGLLYDQDSLDAAWDLVKDWSPEEHDALKAGAPKHALATPFRKGTMQDIAREVVDIAERGLVARGKKGSFDSDETPFLNPLKEIAETGKTPAEHLLDAYHGPWNESVDPLFTEHAY